MPTYSGLVPTVATDVGGASPWTNPNNAKVVDTVEASAVTALIGGSGYTNHLRLTGLGAAVPANEGVTGIEVHVTFRVAGSSIGLACTLCGSGTTGALQRGLSGYLTLHELVTGGPGDTFGLGTVAASDANNASFGVEIWGGSAIVGEAAFIDGVTVTLYTVVLPTGSKNLTLTAAVGSGQANISIGLTAAVHTVTARDVTLTAAVGLALQITSPASGSTVTNAELEIQWLLVPGPQTDYRVRVYSDVGLSALVYDSGVIGSAEMQHTIPPGAVPSPANLWVNVRVTTSGIAGTSAAVGFSTSFAPSVAVTGLTLTTIGGCADPTTLPGIRVTWTQVAPAVGETFISYDIRRRKAGDTDFTRVARIQAIGTVHYNDYQVEARTDYEYALVWQAASGVATLISANQATIPSTQVAFDHKWLHDPNDGFAVRIDGWGDAIQVAPDVRFVQPWGRVLPTAHWGPAMGHRLSLPLHPQLLTRRGFWRDLETLMGRHSALCLRLGRAGELYFCAISAGDRRHDQKQYATSLNVTEIYHDEAV